MKVKSVEKKIIVKEITLETIEERVVILAMINLAFETKNFQVRAENLLKETYNLSVFSDTDDIQEMLDKIKIAMY